MRARFAAVLSLVACTISAGAPTLSAQAVASVCKDGTSSSASGRGTCSGHGGVDAKATAAARMVTCTDGTLSKSGRGACSHHGGIAKASAGDVTPAPSRAARRGEDNDATGAIAQCKDGLYSHAANHRGACSKHGGVAKFLK